MNTGYLFYTTWCKPTVALAKDTVLLSNQDSSSTFLCCYPFHKLSIERDYRKALKYPELYLFMFLLALDIQTEVGISGDTTCLSIPGFICLFSGSQENKRYLNKRKGALNSLVAKAQQLNLFSFNENLSWNLSPAGIKQLPWCFNFIILP